jgi:hypothetical protein
MKTATLKKTTWRVINGAKHRTESVFITSDRQFEIGAVDDDAYLEAAALVEVYDAHVARIKVLEDALETAFRGGAEAMRAKAISLCEHFSSTDDVLDRLRDSPLPDPKNSAELL